ncbi:S1C family serine protease [Tuwongella immobilis]|uniref:PDZ domain-containing protein n=1 Tax=Tuwongella immobilis TaxID=692036 RepID=A0A6C2YMB9_9BACT|nr:PDZ domain-containing protein [Tuwongella immobilis]VIP02273.1 pdz dhr glgf domain protein : PDZ/DHR/GLGF domain protein OS=Pirellula staleyi (strain ATCC 27377 / DSM 6068 / ICPB 4128) GN=Psta_3926 PE=4 SV=1: Trypsin_2: PDZ_2 [Tuwongella immobilis]VTS00905.1 pdz dhr glgf domain protein : PDZ/DHR/GLGF domain protein OS=Pirellula staleyi (strain ATCC 27377 / DSM 6068 / ICPB 4128) GN=Psta_3926 PE=4 SV=1: Trypsin_2: PDZ_2 [Tuwongella immobilis]
MSRSVAIRSSRWISALGLALVLSPTSLFAQSANEDPFKNFSRKNASAFLQSFKDPIKDVLPSVVRVRIEDQDVALGTVVRSDGYIVTKNSELVGDLQVIFRDDRKVPAKVVATNEAFDLALIKVELRNLPVVKWANTAGTVGNWVASPGMDSVPAAVGVVSVGTRTLSRRELAIETTVPQGGFLGIEPIVNESRIMIKDVVKNSAAEKAGVKKNDYLLAIGDQRITTREGVFEALSKSKPGQTIEILLNRGGEEIKLLVKLGRRQGVDRSDVQNAMGSTLSTRKMGFPVILQHDTVLKATDCGGPLVDLDGKVLGLNIARAGRVESYAIPTDALQKALQEMFSSISTTKAKPAETTSSTKSK